MLLELARSPMPTCDLRRGAIRAIWSVGRLASERPMWFEGRTMPSHHAGHVAAGFEPVQDAFLANFTDRGEVGAAVCVYRDGRCVVDLCGGVADVATGRSWDERTLCLGYSMTKGVTTICAHRLVEQGRLDLDAPVASYWPAFAANGKDAIPVRWLLSHRAGLPVVEGDFTAEQALAWFPVVDALAAQSPLWPPGTAHGYHMRSFGWLVGEVIRRIDGRTVGRFFADEIAAPLGLDYWIGLPASLEPRVATLIPPPPEFVTTMASLPPDILLGRVISGPAGRFAYDARWNERPYHAAELPSSNGIGTAHALARLYASLIGPVDGMRTLRDDTVAAACVVQSNGPDRVLMLETCFGTGFMRTPTVAAGAGPSVFGHGGAGGSVAFADPEAGISFTYLMNHLRFDLSGDPRNETLVRAVYDCL